MYKIIKYALNFYRAKNWGKALGLCLFGLTAGGFIITANPFLFFVNVLQSIFLFSFLFSFHDLNDFIVENKKYLIGNLISKSTVPIKAIFFLCSLPLILSIFPLFLNFSVKYLVCYLAFLLLAIFYSLPRIRLGDIPFVDTACIILLFSLIFLQSYFYVNQAITSKFYFFILWIICYYLSLEILHQLSHFENDINSTARILGKRKSISFFKLSFLASSVVSVIICIFFNELRLYAILMLLFGIFRYVFVHKIDEKENFEKLRNRMGGFIEGVIYVIFNILKV